MIVVSQSGETADSLAALRAAKAMGVPTLAVVNVVGSSIAREADHVLYTLAGPEIAVATTKAYSAQLSALYAFATELAFVQGKLNRERYEKLIEELLAYIRRNGIRDTYIFTELCAMPDKIPFYEKFGFVANEAQRLKQMVHTSVTE